MKLVYHGPASDIVLADGPPIHIVDGDEVTGDTAKALAGHPLFTETPAKKAAKKPPAKKADPPADKPKTSEV